MPLDALTACRFYVELDGIPLAVFTELSGLQIETTVEEVEEGGNNGFVHRLPGRRRVGNLTLKRGMTIMPDFLSWYTGAGQSLQLARRNLSVVLYLATGIEVMRFNFVNAYPVKWVGPNLRADEQSAAIETLEIAHDGVLLP